jgi:hypothetical protein
MGGSVRRWPAWKICYFAGMAVLLGLLVWIFLVGFLWSRAFLPF